MLQFLAQSYNYQYDYTAPTSVNAGLSGAVLLLIVLIALPLLVLSIVSMWKVFEKAGEKGWKSLIPIYNFWTICELAGKPGWWALVFLVAWVPIVGPIAQLVVGVIIYLELAKAFGKSTGFGILMLLLPIVGFPILAFSKDVKYVGKKYQTISTPPAAA